MCTRNAEFFTGMISIKDFFQTLIGIIVVGAIIMAVIFVCFPNPDALSMGNPPEVPVEEEQIRTAREDSFAHELLPVPEPAPVLLPLADELLTGDVYNAPKIATPDMFNEEALDVILSYGKYAAPSRIVVQDKDGNAFVWSEFEYDPNGTWMKQRVFPLRENENTWEVLYNEYGSVIKTGIARRQLVTYDKGFASEGIGLDRDGAYRYFKREDTDIEYDTDLLYFQSHSDTPLYKIELSHDLVNHVREEKYFEQRITDADFYIFQHRVIDDKDRMRRIVDFSKPDNAQPVLRTIREYDEEARLLLRREYDKDKNVTLEETCTYDAQGNLTAHSYAGSFLSKDTHTPVRYSDYFDRPDDATVRRLSVNEEKGEMEETSYRLTRDADGRLSEIRAESGDLSRREAWTYDGAGNWTSYSLYDGDEAVYRVYVSYRETAYPYSKDPMQRRVLSLEPLSFAAFFDEPVKDAFWWAAPECPVEERFVLSGMYY